MKYIRLTTRLTDSSANCSMGDMVAGDGVSADWCAKGSPQTSLCPGQLVQGTAFSTSLDQSHNSADSIEGSLNP